FMKEASSQFNEYEIRKLFNNIGMNARSAHYHISQYDNETKSNIIIQAANLIKKNSNNILLANEKDREYAIKKNISEAKLDRLTLNDERINAIIKALENIAKLEDPVGKNLSTSTRPNGLVVNKVSVPLGVIGMIYEARPNVTAEAAALAIKSGNSIILRCGSDCFYSSNAIEQCFSKSLEMLNLPVDIVQLIPFNDRQAVDIMLAMDQYIDVIIPRGGVDLCKKISDDSKIPTLLHLDGNCHTYINKEADIDMALNIIENAKLRRPGICGATESLVIDQEIADSGALTRIVDMLTKNNCEIRGDQKSRRIDDRILNANVEDYYREYLDKIISVKIVSDLAEAVEFINKHSSHHTEAIITDNNEIAGKFCNAIDSAIVMHNASTQFADGGEFGMGAEIGISTGKLHARGPVGAEQLTSHKYIVHGDGHIRPL
ncbi:MAG: glutamate-5-semialdehyde dehydrogenase, partial [Pseudomonadota bacterium]